MRQTNEKANKTNRIKQKPKANKPTETNTQMK